MIDNVLLDTDVILDAFFRREPHYEFSRELLRMCEAGKVKGFVTPVIISNIYYLLRKTATHDKVIAKLTQLISITDILKMGKSTVIDAFHSSFTDFEDSLQYVAAKEEGTINFILTRNLKDFRHSKIAVTTPENYLKGVKIKP